MVDDSFGMPDPTWRDFGEWKDCEPNPRAQELRIGQTVRVNYRDRVKFAQEPAGKIDGFSDRDGMKHALVRWDKGPARPVPLWAVVKA